MKPTDHINKGYQYAKGGAIRDSGPDPGGYKRHAGDDEYERTRTERPVVKDPGPVGRTDPPDPVRGSDFGRIEEGMPGWMKTVWDVTPSPAGLAATGNPWATGKQIDEGIYQSGKEAQDTFRRERKLRATNRGTRE